MDQSHAALLGLSFSLSLRVAFDSSVWLGYGCKNSILWLILLLELLKICLSIDFLYSINVEQSHLVNKVSLQCGLSFCLCSWKLLVFFHSYFYFQDPYINGNLFEHLDFKTAGIYHFVLLFISKPFCTSFW